MHDIKIDDEVMARLKREAEPFVDSPNDVLRRLILGGDGGRISSRGLSSVMERATGVATSSFAVPKALAQILGVVRRVRLLEESRIEATHDVAEESGVAFQTVLDKYTRQLGIEAAEFDEMLSELGSDRLITLLCDKFPDQRQIIKQTFEEEHQMPDKAILADWVVESLKSRGGEAHHLQIAKDVWRNHEQQLRTAGDLFFTWQYDLRWAGHRLRDAGVLMPDSSTRKGHWRLRSP